MAATAAQHHLIICLYLLLQLLWLTGSIAQQSYYSGNETTCTNGSPGYSCELNISSTCQTLIYYRVISTSTPISTVSSLFDTSSSAIADASNMSSSSTLLSLGQGLYIPISCSCYGNYTQYDVSYTIVPADTFYKLSLETYEGLTTCKAVEASNVGVDPENLQVNQNVTIPLRCACPSETQRLRNITSLVTYPVSASDNVSSIVDMFKINQQEFLVANNLSSMLEPLSAATTVLLPFETMPKDPPNDTSLMTPPVSLSNSGSGSSSKTGIYVGVAVAVVIFIIILALTVTFFIRKRNKYKSAYIPPRSPLFKPGPQSPAPNLQSEHNNEISVYKAGSGKLTRFTLDEIKQATDDFNKNIKGSVFQGVVKGKSVAIKSMTGDVSSELQILQKVHHGNLVTLLGVCVATPEQAYFVYEYAENGSLSDWLHDSDYSMGSGSSQMLPWNARLQIALDVASALEYIHEHTNPTYVHKDIKSSNILLDARLRAKVANFGMAKSAGPDDEQTRHILGTQGYMAPEYISQGIVSPRIDIFAFGVVLLELLSGEEAIVKNRISRERFLHDAIFSVLSDEAHVEKNLKEWMDPHLTFPMDCAYAVALLARSCVSKDPYLRPTAKDIVYNLSKLLEISLDWKPYASADYSKSNVLDAR